MRARAGYPVGAWLAALMVLLAPLSGARGEEAAPPAKDQSRILPDEMFKDMDSLLPKAPGTAPESDGEGGERSAPPPPDAGAQPPPGLEELESLISEDVPDLDGVELSEDSAKRALDAFAEVYGKFDDAEIAKYPTLQEFADKSPQGAKFAAIIRKHGFDSVRAWNNVIANIGFAYTAIEEGNDDEIRAQIERVEKAADLPRERKQKLLKYLHLLIPSDNNRKVVQALMNDPAYAEKLNLLEGGGEE